MFDLQVQEFKEKIIEDINSCGLPLSVISYVLSDVSIIVKRSLESEIANQRQEREQQLLNETQGQEEIVEIDVSGD